MSSSKIPKIIHYCWFGGAPKNELINKCINSWKIMCPDYEIKEWNENNFNIHINKYVEQAYQNKKWAFVADYARLWVVYNYGGIYLDTDVELIKQLDNLLEYSGFFSSENNIHINTGLGFGFKKGNELVKKIMDDYNHINFVGENGKLDLTPCPIRNTEIIKKYTGLEKFDTKIVNNDICYLPKQYFCPLDYQTGKMNIKNETYAIHWFSATWMTKREKIIRKIKDTIKKILHINSYLGK